MPLRRPTCGQCVYWVVERTADPPTAGHCHRYPPGIYVNAKTGTVVQKFPTTDRNQWCGEWSRDDTELVQVATESAHQDVAEVVLHPPHRRHDPAKPG